MRSIKIAFGLTMAVCLLAVAASSASAAPVWEQCQKVGVPKGSFRDSQCAFTEALGEFEWGVLKGKEEVESKGTLKLLDTVFGVEVECAGVNEGWIGPNGEDEITEISETKGGSKLVKCTTTKGAEKCKGAVANAENLPWKTELTEKGAEIRDFVKTSAKAELTEKKFPAWKVTCKEPKELVDICKANKGASTKMTNIETGAENYVEAEFEGAASGKAACTSGGNESGTVKGSITIKQKNGHGTRVHK
jgi:hypothetical protein